MKKSFFLATVILSAAFMAFATNVKAQAFVDLETGAVFSGYNDIRIPGDGGTLFSLTDDLNTDPSAFIRLRAGATFNSRHTVFVLYAPLTVKASGSIPDAVDYDGETFAANSPLDASYTFNSYRITYRYDIVKRPKFEFGLGFTAKIRDAEIELSSPNQSASKTNVGFVPIINFRLDWKLNDQLGLLFEGDALASKQGRAEDVLLAATYTFSENLTARLGYRILEGGADNDEVYNFSLFNYASVGAAYTF